MKVIVNGKEIEVTSGMTVMQACELAGEEIPHFCYHERLEIAGNCRMCLVKLDKVPKPVASCAQPIADGMVIHTNTPEVKKMREGVMEFLLINHPLDCPICDQGGECDLQDQAMEYGRGTNRFRENKRGVDDKYMGPLVETNMTRCIHCTRCVRFLEDVAGTNELGAVNRGEDMAISTYVEKSITSELSGNIIDLCPVGALTSKPYAFKARSWELDYTESIDVLDAVGSNIRIDTKGTEVMRILPRLHEDINEEWISDRTRFSYDGLKYQRLDVPMIREEGKLRQATWEEAIGKVCEVIKVTDPSKIAAIAGDLTDVETMKVTKDLLDNLGSSNYDCRQDGSLLDNSQRGMYIFNTSISGIEEADQCIIIGSNPRTEATIINARIRKAVLKRKLKVALIGEKVDLTYNYKHLGESPWLLKQIAENQHPYCETFAKAKKPMLIIGASAFSSDDYEATQYYLRKICLRYNIKTDDWNGLNILHTAASRVGGMDIGFLPTKGGRGTSEILSKNTDVLFLLGADEIELKKISTKTFVIYIGHHGDQAAYRADVILPGAAYTEKDATYVNTEGRVQRTRLAAFPPGEAKNDWEIVNQIGKSLGIEGYKTLSELRKSIVKQNQILAQYDVLQKEQLSLELGRMRDFSCDKFVYPIKNYYMTNSISRASKTMAECTRVNLTQQKVA